VAVLNGYNSNPGNFWWMGSTSHVGLSVILHRAAPQVVDWGTLSRYRGYRGNRIPRVDLKTDLWWTSQC
jgi:hypothetical protein